MTERYQLQDMSLFHEALLDFIMSDPRPGYQRRAATHFGVTEGWISQVVNCDAFQARKRDRREAVEGVFMTVQEKTVAVAHQALDRLAEKVMTEPDTKVIADVADKMLKGLGYGSNQGPTLVVNNQTNTVVAVDQDALAAARGRLINEGRVHHANQALPSPETVSGTSLPLDVGQAPREPAGLSVIGAEADGHEAEGESVRGSDL